MGVSYIKTQWPRLLASVICLVIAAVYLINDNELMGIAWTLSFVYWLLVSVSFYNHDRIQVLEKKQERDDAMYELVQELFKANCIDREIMKKYEARLKKLEDKK